MATDSKRPPGLWLLAVVVAVHSASIRLSLHFADQLQLPDDSPGAEPPWYFIRRDYIDGLCRLGGLAVCLLGAVIVWRRYPAVARMIVWFSVLWLGPDVWQAAVIQMSCEDIFEPRVASTRWATFDSYLYDPYVYTGQIAVAVLAVVLAWRFNGRPAAGSGTTGEPNEPSGR